MGQIVSSAAKPKRCNLQSLSSLGTPAAGEHILVSSDNSMNENGQGNFDCYIVGDGQKAATELELKPIAEATVTKAMNAVSSKAVYDELYGTENYIDNYKVLQNGNLQFDANSVVTTKIPAAFNDVFTFNNAYSYICAYNESGTKLDHWSARSSISLTAQIVANVSYILVSFLKTNLSTAWVKRNGTDAWKLQHTNGIKDDIENLQNGVESLQENAEILRGEVTDIDNQINGQKNYTDGYSLDASGNEVENANAILSNNIPVQYGWTLAITGMSGYLWAYDINGNKLDKWSQRNSVSLTTQLAANVSYVRVGLNATGTRNIKVNGEVIFEPTDVEGIIERLEDLDSKFEDTLVSKELLNLTFESQLAVGRFLETEEGHTYRIVPSQTSWAVSDLVTSLAIFWVTTGQRELFLVRVGGELEESYEITLASGEYIEIHVRANIGTELSFTSIDLNKPQSTTNLEKIKDIQYQLSGTDVLDLYPPYKMEPVLANFKYNKNPMNWQPYGDKPLSLLFFSDPHACSIPIQRVMEFANKYDEWIDDVVCGGDNVDSFTNGFTFWQNAGAQRVLPVVGNHEILGGSPTIDGKAITSLVKHSAKEVYDLEFSPFLSATGITIVENKCYWYKDYADSKIRLIALDVYHNREKITVEGGQTYTNYPDGTSVDTGEQMEWFENTLSEAKTLGYSVICVKHSPFLFDLFDNSFTSLEFTNTTGNGLINPENNEIVTIVQSFIDDGGTFIGWLTGHIHQDAVGVVKGFPDQFQMTIDTSRYHYNGISSTFLPYGSNFKIEGRTKAADLFEIVNVDTYKKNITLFRIGCDYDRNGRHIGSLVYNYTDKRVVYVD